MSLPRKGKEGEGRQDKGRENKKSTLLVLLGCISGSSEKTNHEAQGKQVGQIIPVSWGNEVRIKRKGTDRN